MLVLYWWHFPFSLSFIEQPSWTSGKCDDHFKNMVTTWLHHKDAKDATASVDHCYVDTPWHGKLIVVMASQITGNCFSNSLFRLKIKKIKSLHYCPFHPIIGGFPHKWPVMKKVSPHDIKYLYHISIFHTCGMLVVYKLCGAIIIVRKLLDQPEGVQGVAKVSLAVHQGGVAVFSIVSSKSVESKIVIIRDTILW